MVRTDRWDYDNGEFVEVVMAGDELSLVVKDGYSMSVIDLDLKTAIEVAETILDVCRPRLEQIENGR